MKKWDQKRFRENRDYIFDMKKNLFICGTPYQLMTAMKIIEMQSMDQSNDLIFTDATSHIMRWTNMEYIHNYFENVYAISVYEYAKKHIQGFDVMVENEDLNYYVQNRMSILVNNYTDFFIANPHKWLLHWLREYSNKHRNDKIKYHYYDDGIFSYINYNPDDFKGYVELQDAFLYEKRMVLVDYQVPIYSIVYEFSNEMKNYFVNGDIEVEKYNCVLLEHHFSDKHYYEEQDDIFLKIFETEPSGTILKAHHRRKIRNNDSIPILDSMIPFEGILQERRKPLNLVTVFSTAVLLAPFLSKCTTKIILLYKLFREYFKESEYEKMELFVEKLQLECGKNHIFFIPDTKQELFEKFFDFYAKPL